MAGGGGGANVLPAAAADAFLRVSLRHLLALTLTFELTENDIISQKGVTNKQLNYVTIVTVTVLKCKRSDHFNTGSKGSD